MELFDTHCHIQSAGSSDGMSWEGERSTRELWAKAAGRTVGAIIARAHEAGVARMLCVGCDADDSRLAAACAQKHKNCWASIGIHPHEAARYAGKTAELAMFAALAAEPKVVAVGECGLDYFYGHSPKKAQAELLHFQLQLAVRHNLPLVFHVREAFDDFWPVFEQYHTAARPVRGVLHSFTDSGSNLERALAHGLYIGVNGIATFTKHPAQRELYRTIPLTSLLLETDAPFLTPMPDRGKVCEPYHVRTTAEFLSGLRGDPVESLAAATTENARHLFGV